MCPADELVLVQLSPVPVLADPIPQAAYTHGENGGTHINAWLAVRTGLARVRAQRSVGVCTEAVADIGDVRLQCSVGAGRAH